MFIVFFEMIAVPKILTLISGWSNLFNRRTSVFDSFTLSPNSLNHLVIDSELSSKSLMSFGSTDQRGVTKTTSFLYNYEQTFKTVKIVSSSISSFLQLF
jgi:hypothetical protein